MSQEERLQRSSENLERQCRSELICKVSHYYCLCRFCEERVVQHRVSVQVKQEQNNSYHSKNQYVVISYL